MTAQIDDYTTAAQLERVSRCLGSMKDEIEELKASHAALYSALEQLERVESSPHSETVRYLAREDARSALSTARQLTQGGAK